MNFNRISFLKWFFLVIGVFNLLLLLSGKWYYYKALVYNYVGIDDLELFHYRQVDAGLSQPWNTSNSYNRIPLTDSLKSGIEKYQTVAFLVIKNDSVIIEQYADGYSDSSHTNSFSVAKSIVGLLIGIAHDEGKIKSLDQPVCDYFPEHCKEENRMLTIRHLLTMSSGLNYDEGYTSLFSPTTRSYYGTNLRKQMAPLSVVKTPGVNFEYRSSDPQILAFILMNGTGMTLSEYASEKLWKPIGAEHPALWSLDYKNGDEKAYCCFYSNARDFARIGKLMLNKGKWNGKQIVSENYVTQSITPAPLLDGNKQNTSYGYQWWLMNRAGREIFYARGILGQYIVVIPEDEIIFVRLGHERGEKGADGLPHDITLYIDEVLKLFVNNNEN